MGAAKKHSPATAVLSQHNRLNTRLRIHQRKVHGSGKRSESLQCGVACSAESPAAIRSHACCLQRKL